MKDSEHYERMEDVCDDLGMMPFNPLHLEDWGIINSDPRRWREFIDFYETHGMDARIAKNIFELIIASLNDAMENGDELLETVEDFLSKHGLDFPMVTAYWARLATAHNATEFPIAAILRKMCKAEL